MNKNISKLLQSNEDSIIHNFENVNAVINKNIGTKLRECRIELGYSKKALAERIDSTEQHIKNYETGLSYISASDLFIIASNININPAYFFNDLGKDSNSSASNVQELKSAAKEIINDNLRDAIMGIIEIVQTPKKKP